MERRRQVADALLRVVAAEGFEAASIPRIARELGASTGLVQAYFRSKDELLLFAAHQLGDRLRARVEAALARGGDGIKERLLHGMSVIGGADEEYPVEGRVWLAFLARAAVHPTLREVHAEGEREIRERCRLAFEAARDRGELPGDIDPEAEARSLTAFADGLAMQRAVEPDVITGDEVRARLRHYLDRVFGYSTAAGERG
jgi:Transcriptional regulator